MVEVPHGVHPTLQVTDAGRAQSLDLRTGAVAGALAGYRPYRTSASTLDGVSGADTVSASVTASLDPYRDGPGWAPAGSVWLTVTVRVLVQGDRPVTVDGSAFTVTGPTGPTGPIPITGPVSAQSPKGQLPPVAAEQSASTPVPAGAAPVEVQVRFRPRGIGGYSGARSGTVTIS